MTPILQANPLTSRMTEKYPGKRMQLQGWLVMPSSAAWTCVADDVAAGRGIGVGMRWRRLHWFQQQFHKLVHRIDHSDTECCDCVPGLGQRADQRKSAIHGLSAERADGHIHLERERWRKHHRWRSIHRADEPCNGYCNRYLFGWFERNRNGHFECDCFSGRVVESFGHRHNCRLDASFRRDGKRDSGDGDLASERNHGW